MHFSPCDLNMSVALTSLNHSTRLGGWENSDWMSSGFYVIVQSKYDKQGEKNLQVTNKNQ